MAHYSLSDISKTLDTKQSLSDVLKSLEKMLGHTLLGSDVTTVLALYEDYDFTEERILELYKFCFKSRKVSHNYVLKVADTWKEKNIQTVAEVKPDTVTEEDVPEVMAAIYDIFDLKNHKASIVELGFVLKWQKEWSLEDLLILEACRQTVKRIESPSFAYTDRILNSWFEKGITTIALQKEQERNTPYYSEKKKHSDFKDYKQRKYDFAELEREVFGN